MYYSSTDMQDWEGAADHIAEEMEEDSVITYIEIKTPQVFSHYEPSENFSLHRLPMEGNNLAIDDANLTYLREFSDIWYIGWREEGNGGALNRSLNRSTYNSTEIDFHRISLYRFRRQ